jgi:hypothetical protein
MGIFSGKLSFSRLHVAGASPPLFTDEHVEGLSRYAIGRPGNPVASDGVECGWSTGKHSLDTGFNAERNIANDCLTAEMRVDTVRPPGDLRKAYYQAELDALAANNPSGFASARQKREAKQAANERLELEAKDGRWNKRTCIPWLWDRRRQEVLFCSTSLTHLDRFMSLFSFTFSGYTLTPATAGSEATRLASNPTTELGLSKFVPGVTPADVAWIADGLSRDFLGNEFFLWLWWHTEREGDTIDCDDSQITLMVSQGLMLECPQGQTGRDAFAHEGPTRLPEAKRAIQAGKLPRKLGLTLVHRDEQYELQWMAETLAVKGLKLPSMPEDVIEARAKLDTRMDQIRDAIDTLDRLYAAFVEQRTTYRWAAILDEMQKWLAHKPATKAVA